MGCRYFFVALPVLIGLLSSCNSDNLGDNIYLLEGDRREDRVIVQCTGKSFGDCIAGTYLIPMAYEEHFDKNGDYSKFVDSVKSDNDYVIATTISVSNGIKTYWIIDKKKKRLSGIKEQHPSKNNVHSFVDGPLDLTSFLEEKRKKNIRLNF